MQSPFVSTYININDAPEEDRKDYAMVIEAFLRQRLLGVKNKVGVYFGPAFPKVLYVLDENNVWENSEYYYLTELAERCSIERLAPDYISAKVMRELKEGNVFACMGCAAYDEVVTYKINGKLFVESIGRMWDRLALYNTILFQNELQIDQYMPLQNVEIFDSKLNKFVPCYQMNKNNSHDWYRVELNHRTIEVTGDHPFETENRGVVHAKDLTKDDNIMIHYGQYSDESEHFEDGAAWTLGTLICDGAYSGGAVTLSIAATDEDDIEKRYCENMKKYFDIPTKTIFRDRGDRGVYKDIISLSTENQASYYFKEYLNKLFEGFNKAFRKIPVNVFRWNRSAKVAFLAGMIDTDGYIHIDTGECFLGSTNKELALGQMKLVQTLGIPAKVRVNRYKGVTNFNNVRYTVNFYPTEEIINALACAKKKKNFKPDVVMEKMYEIANVKAVTKINNISTRSGWSYDVTTESEHFEISGIYSHNCRSFLSPWKDENGEYKFWGRLTNAVEPSLNRVNPYQRGVMVA